MPNAFGYNQRSEVTNATMGADTYCYEYDPIGNRILSAKGKGQSAMANVYCANALNQYTSISNGQSAVSSPAYDEDGNMLTNGVWSYTWDAENRMVSVLLNGVVIVANVYDHMSRRIVKGTATEERAFLYDGWNVVRETVGSGSEQSATTNFYTWGLDLSGTMQGAGGVGGLLAVDRDGAAYYPAFDANGNVTEYVDASGAVVAHYEFDAFGGTSAQSGPLADAFAHRFSTKYLDPETVMYYYGYRFYLPELGRWGNRDPIEEMGGVLLYGFVKNKATCIVDQLGLFVAIDPPGYDGVSQAQAALMQSLGIWTDPIFAWLFESGDNPRTAKFKDLTGVKDARKKFWDDNANATICSDFFEISKYYNFTLSRWKESDFYTITAHVTGSYNVTVTPNCTGTLTITVDDSKSWKSALRILPAGWDFIFGGEGAGDWWRLHFPNWQRGRTYTFGGELKIKYWWTEPFDCECPCE